MKKNNHNPFFSIVIPLYNKEVHIARAISSVLCQTFKDYELLIVDDGSTDNSKASAKKYIDKRITIIEQENKGVSAARNKGIHESKGKYIAFLDADDEWKNHHLKDFKQMIDLYPIAGIYAKSYLIVDRNNNQKRIWEDTLEINEIDFFKESFDDKKYFVTASSVCIPKEILITSGLFKENKPRGEDLDLWARIALYNKVFFYEKISATYFLNAKNRSIQVVDIDEYPFIQSYREINLLDNEILPNLLYIKEFLALQQFLRIKIYLFSGQQKKARNVLFKTKTKLQKTKWLIYFFISLLPLRVLKYIKKIKNESQI